MTTATTPTLMLVGRSTSHYTRVAAIVADELGLPLERRSVRDLASQDASLYGGNPALKLPVLVTPTGAVFGTENICRALVRRATTARNVAFPDDVNDELAQNAQELVWHAMAAQVQWVMGTRVCGLPSDNGYFVKCRLGLEASLGWLDQHLGAALAALPSPRDLSLFEVTLFCLITHLDFRPSVPLESYPALRQFADAYGARPSCRRTPYRTDAATTRLLNGATTMPTRPALDPSTITPRNSSGYPEPFRSRVLPREKRALGDALGLTRIGVNLTTLFPGRESSIRHHHTHEDELIYVLEGEVVLRTDAGEQVLTAGMCAGFKAGSGDGHQLVNRSDVPARYLEVSNRDPADEGAYPDDDLRYLKRPDGSPVFTHRDGTPY